MSSCSDPAASNANQQTSTIINVGDLVADKYKVQSILGRGGMGVVVAATHVHLREQVALKILLPWMASDRQSRARFLREARVTARLRNEHIAQVMDFGVLDTGSPYFVMEYIDGVDLRKLIKSRGPLEVPVAVNFVAQASEGIAEAHARNIVHRDLKPSNLLLTTNYDGSDLIKILDFGVSKVLQLDPSEDTYHTAAGTVLGSPAYMSPERLEEQIDALDARTDVWSLAVILYELLAGRSPYWDPSPAVICANVLAGIPPPPLRSMRPDVPAELEEAIVRGMARDIDKRTSNVAQFAAELLLAMGGQPRARTGISLERIQATLEQTGNCPAVRSTDGAIGADKESYEHSTLVEVRSVAAKKESARKLVPADAASHPPAQHIRALEHITDPTATTKPIMAFEVSAEPATSGKRWGTVAAVAIGAAVLVAVVVAVLVGQSQWTW